MPTLAVALQDQDPGYLRIVAALWGLDLRRGSAAMLAGELSRAMLDPGLLSEIIDGLPPLAYAALEAVQRNEGRLPLADLTRKYGPLRQMGPGRRDREQPWRNGPSALEALWYRGLIARSFLDTPAGPQEFGYIPDDLLAQLPATEAGPETITPKPATQLEQVWPTADWAVDDLVTLLAALRRRPPAANSLSAERVEGLVPFLHQPTSIQLLVSCLVEKGVLPGDKLKPDPEAVRELLDSNRCDILDRLRRTWTGTKRWNDLAHIPHLRVAQGGWPNDPLVSRQAILEFLGQVAPGEWWDLAGFIQSVEDIRPFFQRPAGAFDSWYLQDTRTGAFLRGLGHWHAVEGALIHGLITGPLHWLGMADLGSTGSDGPIVAFRLTPAFAALSRPVSSSPPSTPEIGAQVILRPDGLITVPRLAPPVVRYQIARFCAWEARGSEVYQYRLTPDSLRAASEQGLQVGHARAILSSASETELPQSLSRALDRWAERGTEARLERLLVFRVGQAAVLEELRTNRATNRFVREVLGPTSACVAERDWRKLCEAAARLGILIEPPGHSSGEAP